MYFQLPGVPPSRGGTQPRPSGAPAISANPRPQQQQPGAIMESREPQFARPNGKFAFLAESLCVTLIMFNLALVTSHVTSMGS